MVTLIESTVRVTIRHSDNPPIASEAATASVSRDEATGAVRASKPAAPGDRIMAEILKRHGRIIPRPPRVRKVRWQYWGAAGLENGKLAAMPRVMAAMPSVMPVIPADIPVIQASAA